MGLSLCLDRFQSLIQVKSTVLPFLHIKQCEAIWRKCIIQMILIYQSLYMCSNTTGNFLHITQSSAQTWHCGWGQTFVHLLSLSSGVICLSFLSPPVVWDATYLLHCQENTTTIGHVSEAMAKTCFTVTMLPVNNLSGSQWMSLSSSRNDTITAYPNKPPANI